MSAVVESEAEFVVIEVLRYASVWSRDTMGLGDTRSRRLRIAGWEARAA
jgi:hypothetical protein